MTKTLCLVFLCLSFGAAAATPEDAYIAARDAAIAKIKALEARKADDDADKAHKSASADLQKRLRAIIGDLDVAGYPKEGALNLDSLTDSMVGFGMLDALRFAKGDGGTKGDDNPPAVVTTDGLLERWLRKADWWKKERKAAPSAQDAFKADGFYTEAIGADAAYSKSADLPIAKPEGASFAMAQIGGWAQDVGPNPAQQIVVTLQKGGKTYIVSRDVEKMTPIEACEAIWNTAEKKAGQAKGGEMWKIQNKGDNDYRACVSERLPKEAVFPKLVKEAQSIADSFAK